MFPLLELKDAYGACPIKTGYATLVPIDRDGILRRVCVIEPANHDSGTCRARLVTRFERFGKGLLGQQAAHAV